MSQNYQVFESNNAPVKAWVNGVAVEEAAKQQLRNVASLPFIHRWVAAMPDVHVGKGATVGSVIATKKAIIPAAVGVDIGCGMIATRTTLTSQDLPDSLAALRGSIERAVPHGRSSNGGRGDRGAWGNIPEGTLNAWNTLYPDFKRLTDKHPELEKANTTVHLGTLGSGNHFIELCLDEADRVWVMLHSGSRGIGNRIGSHFIEKAKMEMERWFIHLPDKALAYLSEGSLYFEDYVDALDWAQRYAATNRQLMLEAVLQAMRAHKGLRPFEVTQEAVNCHHNYVAKEHHYGENVFVTRKGAVRARAGDLGIIPGSMGTRSYIVRGKGNAESFCSCSHGAGRSMTRTAARKQFTVEDHRQATLGVECKKDESVLDETPLAYKPIESVMEAQKDLVDIVHTLKQVLCVKG